MAVSLSILERLPTCLIRVFHFHLRRSKFYTYFIYPAMCICETALCIIHVKLGML